MSREAWKGLNDMGYVYPFVSSHLPALRKVFFYGKGTKECRIC